MNNQSSVQQMLLLVLSNALFRNNNIISADTDWDQLLNEAVLPLVYYELSAIMPQSVTEKWKKTDFARLPTEAEADQLISCAPVTIYKNGIQIELSTDYPPEMMRTLIHVLCSNA